MIKTFFVAQGVQIDVASQGLSLEEALENIRDAARVVEFGWGWNGLWEIWFWSDGLVLIYILEFQ